MNYWMWLLFGSWCVAVFGWWYVAVQNVYLRQRLALMIMREEDRAQQWDIEYPLDTKR